MFPSLPPEAESGSATQPPTALVGFSLSYSLPLPSSDRKSCWSSNEHWISTKRVILILESFLQTTWKSYRVSLSYSLPATQPFRDRPLIKGRWGGGATQWENRGCKTFCIPPLDGKPFPAPPPFRGWKLVVPPPPSVWLKLQAPVLKLP